MLKRCLKIFVIMVLILLPVGVWWFSQDVIEPLYREMTGYPKKITIAAGSEGGRYSGVSKALKNEIENKLGVVVVILPTDGSLGNLLCLQADTAELALYQPGAFEILGEHDGDLVRAAAETAGLESPTEGKENVAFVANMYLQPANFIVRNGANIERPGDLKDLPVSVGLKESGDYAMSLLLLEHFGLTKESIDKKHLSYPNVEKGFANGSLDAAFNTVGMPAPVLDLFKTGKCDILKIPHAKALARKHVFVSEYTIPAGLYRSQPPAKPAKDTQTVALPAQLLTRKDLNSDFIHDLTDLVLDKHFASRNNLEELLEGGHEFAQANPEYPTHPGAQSVYEPQFDVHLIETGEAAYSLAVSTFIAVFFSVRWLGQQRAKKRGHKLDVYIQKLLTIEKRQIGLDADSQANDLPRLQKMLDEVTFLRQEALGVFSVYELNEDRGTDCFIVMCHALSHKINAKLSRQRLDRRFEELTEAIKAQNQPASDENSQSEDNAQT